MKIIKFTINQGEITKQLVRRINVVCCAHLISTIIRHNNFMTELKLRLE